MIYEPIADPDHIADRIQACMNKLFKESPDGKVKIGIICLNTMKVIQKTLKGFFTKEYVKKSWELMKERHANGKNGYFKWGMVKYYYELKEMKKKRDRDVFNMLMEDFCRDPMEESDHWNEFGDN